MGVCKAELCRRLGIDPKSNILSSYEKGRTNPSHEMAVKLLNLGMTVEELFGIPYNKIHGLSNIKGVMTSEDLGRAFRYVSEYFENGGAENFENMEAKNESSK